MDKTWEQQQKRLVAGDKSSKVLKPANRSLDLPAVSIAAQLASIMCRRLLEVLAMRADQFDASLGKLLSQGVAIRARS